MDFAYHRLRPLTDNHYELVLYIDFKSEIGRLSFKEIIDNTDHLQKQINKYIIAYLPDVNISSVKVMLGAVIVTSFLLAAPGTTQDSDFDEISVVNPPNQQYIPNPNENSPKPGASPPDISGPGEEQPANEDQTPIQSARPLPPNFGTNLVLVNKQHSLSANYVPANLVSPLVRFTFAEDLPQRYMVAEAAHALEMLFSEAEKEGKLLYAVSGYRSYQRQAEIFARNSANSADANRFSARAGQSEHQTGLAMDITNATLGVLTQEFGNTPEGYWLYTNAARFGFIIRYPNGKEQITGYAYEPWHIRYVGVETAQKIINEGITLEEYLGAY